MGTDQDLLPLELQRWRQEVVLNAEGLVREDQSLSLFEALHK